MMVLRGRPALHITCSVEGCERKHYGKSYCTKHYSRFRSTGTPYRVEYTGCTVDDCGREVKSKGLCSGHYMRAFLGTKATGPIRQYSAGDDWTYWKAHRRLYRQRGAASDYSCITCGKQAEHWALQPGGASEVDTRSSSSGRLFSRNLNDYAPMCLVDHFAMDAVHSLKRSAVA